MSTNNPFAHHTNKLFASRGCDIDQAMSYANDVITAMPTEVQSHAMTALMVVINTAANAFDQARGPSPEKLAILALIRNEIDNWASSYLDNHIEAWADNNLDISDKVQEYINDNLDIENSILEWMNENLESHISDAIDNIDLVVRIR
jgi:phosphoenolpyruvate carboxylase